METDHYITDHNIENRDFLRLAGADYFDRTVIVLFVELVELPLHLEVVECTANRQGKLAMTGNRSPLSEPGIIESSRDFTYTITTMRIATMIATPSTHSTLGSPGS